MVFSLAGIPFPIALITRFRDVEKVKHFVVASNLSVPET
jgi:hypothetical protein